MVHYFEIDVRIMVCFAEITLVFRLECSRPNQELHGLRERD